MPGSYTANLNMRLPLVGGDSDIWGGVPYGLNEDLTLIDAVFMPDGSTGTPVGLNVGTGKTLGLGGTLAAIASSVANLVLAAVSVAASRFSVVDATDATKVMQFDASGITTGTTRTLATPDKSGTLALMSDVNAVWNTGDIRPTFRPTTMPAPGWLFLDDSTIGPLGSNAVHQETGATTTVYQALYRVLWLNPYCQTRNSSGVVVAKGANADADWTNLRQLTLPVVLGRALAAASATFPAGVSGGSDYHGHSVTVTSVFGTVISNGNTDQSQPSTSNHGTTGGPGAVCTDYVHYHPINNLAGYISGSYPSGGGGSTTGDTGSYNSYQPTVWANVEIKL